MEWFDAVILGFLQGVTEFLPISSSGHLILGEYFLDLDFEKLKSFDVAVHIATLLAVLVYFWRDVWGMLLVFGRIFVGKWDGGDFYSKLIIFIIIGTIPAVVVGLFGEDAIDGLFRNVTSVGIFMIIVGVVYVIGEKFYKKADKTADLKWHHSLIIGCAQALALIPGVSRSGSTIIAGLFQGIDRSLAARFSFLLGIPAILGAGILTSLDIANGEMMVGMREILIGGVSAFLFGILAIHFLMNFIKKHTFIVFAIYLIALGFSVLI